MQLYHHAFSVNSQKVRLALEEKELDYNSHSLNPVTGKDLTPDLFNINPEGRMPVFRNGNVVLTDTLAILEFIDSMNEPLGGDDLNKEKLHEWMHKLNEWDPNLFILSHIPVSIRAYFSRFKRKVVIAKMAKEPALASKYRLKLHRAYAADDMMKDTEALKANTNQLERLLDMADEELTTTEYLVGNSFTMADVMFLPILGLVELLGVYKKYIKKRKSLSSYWARVKHRPSYHVVIGRCFGSISKYRTFFITFITVAFRDLIRRY